MTSFALNNLWTYLQGLMLSQDDREWLANKLVMPDATPTSTHEVRKGWAAAAELAHKLGDDRMETSDIFEDDKIEEW